MQTLIFRFTAATLAGAAALLAVFALDAQIEDVATLLGAVPGQSDYQRRANKAASACGALGAERESCEIEVMRLEPEPTLDAPSLLAARLGF